MHHLEPAARRITIPGGNLARRSAFGRMGIADGYRLLQKAPGLFLVMSAHFYRHPGQQVVNEGSMVLMRASSRCSSPVRTSKALRTEHQASILRRIEDEFKRLSLLLQYRDAPALFTMPSVDLFVRNDKQVLTDTVPATNRCKLARQPVKVLLAVAQICRPRDLLLGREWLLRARGCADQTFGATSCKYKQRRSKIGNWNQILEQINTALMPSKHDQGDLRQPSASR